ncbi:Arylsulfotransferase-domain-containing protein [Xylaria arbuscula]|nr:Arylsulfotransferase-domain-containing protein [Xylaria arbuscula]
MTRILQWLLTVLAVAAIDARVWAYDVFSSSLSYELGFYGLYPTANFKTSELAAPLLSFSTWDEQKCSDGYYLFALKGKLVSDTAATIFDSHGELVWADDSYGVVFNLEIQEYQGENYITFWSSPEGSNHGYGRGTYYMLDSSYQLYRKFDAIGDGLRGDLHEFHITERGTVLITAYNPVPADLTSVGGPQQGWALDSMFQEIDIATGDLVFEWSSLEHVPLDHGVRSFAGDDPGTSPETAFDYFHINSVVVDEQGNYVISGRHISAILCIDSKTGNILWTLGGVANDFADLSGGAATDFMYQHHARLHANNTLSLFDNAAAERRGQTSTQSHSRGMLMQLDTENMTVSLVREYFDRANPRTAVSQGSMQVLEDRVVLGYGWLPFITELALDYDPDSDDGSGILCAVELAPWVAARWGLVNTYRAFKAPEWVGNPAEPPAVYFEAADKEIYVSWNGATEVDRWVLQGADWADLVEAKKTKTAREAGDEREVEQLKEEEEGGFVDLDIVDREAFETVFEITEDMPQYLRIAAVDKQGNVLRHSQIVNRKTGNSVGRVILDFVSWLAVALVLTAAVLFFIGKRGRKAVLATSSRGCEMFGCAASVCWDRVRRMRSTGWIYNHYPGRSWRDWVGARAHELQSMYHD